VTDKTPATRPALTARADRRLIRPHDRSKRFVLVEVTAPPATTQRERLPVNLAFVLDRSGSMSGQKIALAKQTIVAALDRLDGRDRFSVVAYDDVVDLVIESTPASAEARRNALTRLDTIDARGSTNLFDGWLRGCEQVAAHLAADGVNRTLLLTDGLANRGTTDPDVIANHAAELRARGVSTTTFGVGTDFDESLLQRMADAGGGHFYYVADAVTIRDHISSEVGETLEVVARDVELEVVAAEEVGVETISPQAVRRHGTRSLVALGDLVAEQVLDVVLRLTFPYGDLGRETGVIIGLRDRDGVFAAADARLAWTYADDHANDTQPRDPDVDRAVARQFAARARQEAVGRNRAGEFAAAQSLLAATARQIRAYAGVDPELRALVQDLETEGRAFALPMAEASRKQVYFASANVARTRDAQGRSIKRS
jgi:Ca-activated chloride channel family protein